MGLEGPSRAATFRGGRASVGVMVVSGFVEGTAVGATPPPLASPDFDAFYRERYRPLLRLALGFLGDRARAEELVQDAFERTLLRWPGLDNPAAFLTTVLVNRARSELRHRRVVRRWTPPPPGVVEVAPPDDALLAALARLTPRRRIAVVLRVVDDRSEHEVASLMGCSVGTVKSLVSRGLADLRSVVER
jgi:RNA polymerase sigma-70 factor (sigma-E family)